ncbi:Protein AEXR-1, partial [Aphelenchoides avenae]
TSYVILIASCFATVANVLVIYAARRIFRRNGVFTHSLIIMMSIADFLLSAYAYPMSSLQLVLPSIQSVGLCASVQTSIWLGQALSSWFLSVINLDRLYFFKYPLRYILLTKKYPIAVGVFVVTSSVGSVSALWLSGSSFVTNTCDTA